MSMKINVVLCVVMASVMSIAPPNGVNYCDLKSVKCVGMGDKTHVGCNNPLWNGGFGPSCVNASLVPMTPELQQVIVATHNKLRNQQAIGNVSEKFEPATLMATMVWDKDLADLAELAARNCVFAHDACVNTKKWFYAGQNLAIDMSFTPVSHDIETVKKYTIGQINRMFNEWKNSQYYNWMDAINGNYTKTPGQSGKVIGHWTEIVQSINQAVGCAVTTHNATMQGTEWYAIHLVCNYAFTNGIPAYTAGEPSSSCTSKNPEYPGLCGLNQKYTVFGKPYPLIA